MSKTRRQVNGHDIEQQPAVGEGEENCPGCGEVFDRWDPRRYSIIRCGHMACYKCIVKDCCNTGCRQCDQSKKPVSEATSSSTNSTCTKLPANNGDRIPKQGKDNASCLPGSEKAKEGDQNNDNPNIGKKGPPQSFKPSKNNYMDSIMNWFCRDCPFTCVEKITFGLHMRKEHSAKRPFNCDQCEWCCRTEADLLNHKKNHSLERPFKCPSCEKRFCKRYILVRHMEKQPHQDCKVQLIFDSAGSIDSLNCPTCGVKYETGDNRDSFHRKARYAECGHICCLDCIMSREGCAQCDKAKDTAEGKEKKPEGMIVVSSSSSEGQPPKKKQKQLPLSSTEK